MYFSERREQGENKAIVYLHVPSMEQIKCTIYIHYPSIRAWTLYENSGSELDKNDNMFEL